jgi:ribosome maturation factor RimP
MNFEKELKDYIKKCCDGLGIIFVDASIHGHNKKYNIKVIADTEKGITLEECQRLSREISDIIFRKDLINSDYRLDVSSPGVEKPLQHEFEYKRSIGKDLIVNYQDEAGINKELVGRLINYSNSAIILAQKKDEIKINMNQIIKAKIKLKW